MEKTDILEAIRRCAEDNGGVALGRERFEALTGITESRWSGRYWVRWSDAIVEAGYEPGAMNAALADEDVLGALAGLTQELGRYPTQPEMVMKRRMDTAFPSAKVFNRYGNKAGQAARLIEFCGNDPALAEVVAIAEPVAARASKRKETEDPAGDGLVPGQVYLMKSGAHYKIGRSNATGRRAYELAIQLPDRLEMVHVIETDDAVGIERYWHERFADRRRNGEWFKLSATDVAAFKRRKRYM